jgi:Bacterial regulatory proteins, luxR family
VKVHVRNIMKKLNATNRTQVAYMTRGLFEAIGGYNPPQKIAGMAAR